MKQVDVSMYSTFQVTLFGNLKFHHDILLCQCITSINCSISLSHYFSYSGDYVAPPSYDEAPSSSPTGSSDAPPPPL